MVIKEWKKMEGIVEVSTAPKEFQGKLQIGFKLQGVTGWFNIKNEDAEELELVRSEVLQKGNKIEFNFEPMLREIEEIKVLEKAQAGKSGNWADDMTNFEDLLTAAHEKGLISINTEMIQIDPKEKFAVFKATITGRINQKNAELGDVGIFTGYGDAEGIENDKIKVHWIRMAETRSIVRALRWYTNNAAVAEEETK